MCYRYGRSDINEVSRWISLGNTCYRYRIWHIDVVIYHMDMVTLDIDMGDGANEMGDDSIDMVISHTVPRIYEISSRRAPTFVWPNHEVCQCRSQHELLVRKLSHGQVECARSLRELPIRSQSGSRLDEIS